MQKQDMWTSLVWFGAGLLIVFSSPGLDLGTPSAPGSGFMPFLTGLIVCLFSAVTFIQAALQRRQKQASAWAHVQVRKLVVVILLLLVYVFLLKPIGYLLCTFFLILALTRFIGSERWPAAVMTSVLGSSLSYLLFDTLLKAYLPKGILGW